MPNNEPSRYHAYLAQLEVAGELLRRAKSGTADYKLKRDIDAFQAKNVIDFLNPFYEFEVGQRVEIIDGAEDDYTVVFVEPGGNNVWLSAPKHVNFKIGVRRLRPRGDAS